MVSSPRQCFGVEGKVCNRFLPRKENDPHRLCVACHGKSCMIDYHCEDCHDWSDDHCKRVSDYMHKLSLQRERKTKASSSSSFSGFLPLMRVPLCRLPSPAGTGVVTTTPLSVVCAVTFSAAAPIVSAAPFVPPVDITSVEPSCKQHRVDSLRKKASMLAVSEDIWASGQSFAPLLGPSSAPQPQLVTPPAVPTSVPACGSRCGLDRSCGCFFNPLRHVFPFGRIFVFERVVMVPSVALASLASHAVPVGPCPG